MNNNKLFIVLMGIICLCACGTSKKGVDTEKAAVSVTFDADSAYAFCAAQCAFESDAAHSGKPYPDRPHYLRID